MYCYLALNVACLNTLKTFPEYALLKWGASYMPSNMEISNEFSFIVTLKHNNSFLPEIWKAVCSQLVYSI